MKRTIVTFIVTAIVVFLFIPSLYARPGHYRGHANPGYYHGHSHSSWTFSFGAVFGGWPYYYPPPAPVYVYGPPVYAYPPPVVYRERVYMYPDPPNRAYAYPDPSLTRKSEAPPPGEWVTVPGQWVNGTWVPEHRAWSPTP